MYRRLFFVVFLFLISCAVCFSVLADDIEPKGFFEFANDFFDVPEDSEDLATYEDNDGIALMSVSTDDIDNGLLTIEMFGAYQTHFFSGSDETFINTRSCSTSSLINSVVTSSTFKYPAGGVDICSPFVDVIRITQTTSSTEPILKKGSSFDFSLSNVQLFWDYKHGSKYTNCYFNGGPGWGEIRIYDIFDNVYTLQCESLNFKFQDNNKYMNIWGSSGELPADVYKIDIVYYTDLIDTFGIPEQAFDEDYTGTSFIPHHSIGFYNSVLVLTENEKNEAVGLLQSIIIAVNNIKDGIINLPSNIANFFVEGIKSLFVPTEQELQDWKDKFDVFLSEHLGFLYQIPGYLVDLVKSIYNAFDAPNNTVEMPTYEYDFDGSTFSFGGYTVDLIPEGFEAVVSVLRVIVNIVCTLAFANMALRYFERILTR